MPPKLPLLDRIRQFFGKEIPWDDKEPRLVRYTTHAPRCEVCKKALKNGDILFTFDYVRNVKGERVVVKERLVWAHAACLVHTPRADRMYWAEDAPRHKDAVQLGRTDWEEWLKSATE